MKNITNEQMNRIFGKIFKEYRLKNNLTQEKLAEELSKSTKTISQIETAKDGTSKNTDIDLMNFLEIEPNVLYADFITNPKLKKKINISKRVGELSEEKLEAINKIIEIIEEI